MGTARSAACECGRRRPSSHLGNVACQRYFDPSTMAVTVESLLRGGLSHVPRYGFTLKAIVSGTRGAAENEWALRTLFPGPDYKATSAPRRLFDAWDNDARRRAFVPLSDAPANHDEAHKRAISLLEKRLDLSSDVQGHLLPAFALLSTYPATDASLSRAVAALLPIVSALPTTGNIVDPIPLVHRSLVLADEACSAAGMRGEYGVSTWLTGPNGMKFACVLDLHMVQQVRLYTNKNSSWQLMWQPRFVLVAC